MSLSAKEAAEQVGLSKQAIIKAINRGQLSATKDRKGEWRIDAAELFRVWEPVKSDAPAVDAPVDTAGDMVSTGEAALLREMLAAKDDVIADLRRRLDAEADERRRLTALLTVKDDTPKPANWWQRLFRRGV